jgi:hypothetical protein
MTATGHLNAVPINQQPVTTHQTMTINLVQQIGHATRSPELKITYVTQY